MYLRVLEESGVDMGFQFHDHFNMFPGQGFNPIQMNSSAIFDNQANYQNTASHRDPWQGQDMFSAHNTNMHNHMQMIHSMFMEPAYAMNQPMNWMNQAWSHDPYSEQQPVYFDFGMQHDMAWATDGSSMNTQVRFVNRRSQKSLDMSRYEERIRNYKSEDDNDDSFVIKSHSNRSQEIRESQKNQEEEPIQEREEPIQEREATSEEILEELGDITERYRGSKALLEHSKRTLDDISELKDSTVNNLDEVGTSETVQPKMSERDLSNLEGAVKSLMKIRFGQSFLKGIKEEHYDSIQHFYYESIKEGHTNLQDAIDKTIYKFIRAQGELPASKEINLLNVNFESLAPLTKLPAGKLESLSLGGKSKPKGLTLLSKDHKAFDNLGSLTLSNMTLTISEMEAIATLPGLESLELRDINISQTTKKKVVQYFRDRDINVIFAGNTVEKAKQEEVEVEPEPDRLPEEEPADEEILDWWEPVTIKAKKDLSDLSETTDAVDIEKDIELKDLSALLNSPNIKELRVSENTKLQDLSVFKKASDGKTFQKLRSISILGAHNQPGLDLSALSKLPKLEYLDLYNSHFHDISPLAKLPEGQLKTLIIGRSHLESLEVLDKPAFKNLELLSLRHLYIEGDRRPVSESFDKILGLKKLTDLNLCGNSDVNASHINKMASKLTNLNSLSLGHADRSKDILKITKLPSTLKRLELEGSNLTNAKQLAALTKFTSLEKIDLSENDLSKIPVEQLKKIKLPSNLKELWLHDTGMSQEQVDALLENAPKDLNVQPVIAK